VIGDAIAGPFRFLGTSQRRRNGKADPADIAAFFASENTNDLFAPCAHSVVIAIGVTRRYISRMTETDHIAELERRVAELEELLRLIDNYMKHQWPAHCMELMQKVCSRMLTALDIKHSVKTETRSVQ
jgi:hypothetical protein